MRLEVVEELGRLQAEARDLAMAMDAAERTAAASASAMDEKEREATGLRMALAAAEEKAKEGSRAIEELQRSGVETALALEHTAAEMVSR